MPSVTLDPNTLTGRIVFSHEGDVYTMNAAGSDRRRLTDHPELDCDPVWSPDWTRIVFRSHSVGEVYVMNADGSGQRPLIGGTTVTGNFGARQPSLP